MASEEMFSDENYDALYSRILMMGVADKIKLAMTGNQAVRSILLRDPNKMVAVAVIKSPNIEQAEIETIARSRSVCEEVLRSIASKEEWMKCYRVKLNLATNPKTPVPVALNILLDLDQTELEALAADTEIDPQVSLLAGKLIS
jgi:hypothetical protein